MSIRNSNLEQERSPVGMGIRKVCQRVKVTDFTDGLSTSGTLTLKKTIPAGSFVIGSKVKVETAFIGDTSAHLAIGDGSDADTYSGNTYHSVFTAADNLVKAAFITTDCGIVALGSAGNIVLTLTSGSDFTNVTAGQMFVEVFYFSTNPEVVDYYENKFQKAS
jgi:PKD repeat protein